MPMSPRDRRALIIFGAIAVVAVAVFFLFVRKGSDGSQQSLPRRPNVVNPPAASPSAAPSKKPTKQVLVFSGRDPFDPAQGGGFVAPAPGSAAVSPPGSPSSGPSGGSSQNVGGKTVVLVSIFTQDSVEKAQVEVDGAVYTVAEGDSFDDGYRLVSIDGSCANFTYNNSTSFTLCEVANK